MECCSNDGTFQSFGHGRIPGIIFSKVLAPAWFDIFNYCLSVLNGDIEMDVINKNHIVLIPKIEKSRKISQFRSISLCNVLYKIIAKVLVNRINGMLDWGIDKGQGAFILKRLISDNVMITYKILYSLKMKKKGKRGNFTLKIGMSKEYDRVEWDFLVRMMAKLGFHMNEHSEVLLQSVHLLQKYLRMLSMTKTFLYLVKKR